MRSDLLIRWIVNHYICRMSSKCKDLKSWMDKGDEPLLIAGPCSAESEEQMNLTADLFLKHRKPNILRAGIWKPRTRPNSFEGVGEVGLKWLKDAGIKLNIPVITEVANTKHVEQALKAGIDMLWIGARTTVNPFLVQEIAESLRGVDIPVFVKNPINPDVNLWIGALERFQAMGINKLVAIHRGFSSYDRSVYRNVPMWEIPIELKANCPEVELICDPSHIAGTRDLLKQICQRAFDLDFAGLMIETHPNPESALSDKEQQITPKVLDQLCSSLKPRDSKISNQNFITKLEILRDKIDEIDASLLKTLAQRLDIIREIGTYKKDNNVTVLQIDRWKRILDTRLEWSNHLELNETWMKELLSFIHTESIRVQTEMMAE